MQNLGKERENRKNLANEPLEQEILLELSVFELNKIDPTSSQGHDFDFLGAV